MFIKIIGSLMLVLFLALTVVGSIAVALTIASVYSILIGILYILSGYLFGLVLVYLFPVSVAAVATWSGITLPVPLFFAVLNLAVFFAEKVVNSGKTMENIANYFKKMKKQ